MEAFAIKEVIEGLFHLGQALDFLDAVNPDDLATAERRFLQKIVNIGSLGIVAGDTDGIMVNDLAIRDHARLG